MRILVTGSEGSLMQAVIPKLIAAGHTVIGIDKCGPHADHMPYQFIEQDIVQMTGKWHFNVDMIIHAAATIYGVGGFNAFCGDILGNDLVMTRNMLNIAALNDVKKFVYLSSSMVYERCNGPVGGVEEYLVDMGDFPVPFTDYGLSKFTGERMVKAYSKQYGLKYVIWRPFNIITPHEMAKGVPGYAHVFADFFHAILVKKSTTVPIISPGVQTRCFTWIEDVADAIVDHSVYAEGAYNIGSNEEISMMDLLKMIWVESGRDLSQLTFDFKPCIINDVMKRKPNVEKIKIDLDWEAKTNLKTSIRRCLAEYAIKGYT
jgi:UDP-glucose 4-epimerase